MNAKVNFGNLVRQLLPVHKRQPGRLFLLRAMVSPIAGLFLAFESWRREMRIQINMTGQVGVLQGYLQAKYKSSEIRIESYIETGFGVGLEEEGESHVALIGLEPPADQDSPALIPLYGEVEQQLGDVNFVVYVPASFDERTLEAMRIDIERYKQALVKYKIIQ